MTTPERLRRRQRIEGGLLIFLAIMMLLQAWYFHHQDDEQKGCIANQFEKLTVSYTARGHINERDSKAKTKVITEISKAKDEAEVRTALNEFVTTQADIDADRKKHPVPPFPPGKCDE